MNRLPRFGDQDESFLNQFEEIPIPVIEEEEDVSEESTLFEELRNTPSFMGIANEEYVNELKEVLEGDYTVADIYDMEETEFYRQVTLTPHLGRLSGRSLARAIRESFEQELHPPYDNPHHIQRIIRHIDPIDTTEFVNLSEDDDDFDDFI